MARDQSTDVALSAAQIELAQAHAAQDVDGILAAQATVDDLKRRLDVERQIAAKNAEAERQARRKETMRERVKAFAELLTGFEHGSGIEDAIAVTAKAYKDACGEYLQIRQLLQEILGHSPLSAEQHQIFEHAFLLRTKLAGLPTRGIMTDLQARPVDEVFRTALESVVGELRTEARRDPTLAAAVREFGL